MMPDTPRNEKSDFERAFSITCGVLVAIVVAAFVLPVGCAACVGILGSVPP